MRGEENKRFRKEELTSERQGKVSMRRCDKTICQNRQRSKRVAKESGEIALGLDFNKWNKPEHHERFQGIFGGQGNYGTSKKRN
jgi:hypothetical protein